MKKTLRFISFVFWVAVVTSPAQNTVLKNWRETEQLPLPLQMHTMTAAEGFLYIIGGRESFDWHTARANVFFTRIKEDGSIARWQKTTPLPQAVAGHTTVVSGKRIYVISGKGHGSDNIMKNPVSYTGVIEDDGSISSWKSVTALPDGTPYRGEAVLYNRCIYYVGGFYGRLVFRSEINDDGMLGDWVEVQRMVAPKMHFGLVQDSEVLHVIGGNRSADLYLPEDTILSSKINKDGSIEKWRRNGVLPEPNRSFSLVHADKTVFIIGGTSGTTVWKADFNASGELQGWQKTSPLPAAIENGAAAFHKNRIYYSGGEISEKSTISRSAYMAETCDYEKYSVRFRPTAYIVTNYGRLQLARKYLQSADSSIVIDAPLSTSVDFMIDRADNKISTPETTGDGAIRNVRRLENIVIVDKPGSYQSWYRAYFPVVGDWNHREQMNNGPVIFVEDATEGSCNANEWLLHKGPQYELSTGEHRYLFPSPTAWAGGALLDKIALIPVSANPPSGKGPDFSSWEPVCKESIVSNTFIVDGISAWKLDYNTELRGGEIEIEYSYDKGKSWRSLPSLNEKVEIDIPRNYLAFRLTMKASENGESPLLKDINVFFFN